MQMVGSETGTRGIELRKDACGHVVCRWGAISGVPTFAGVYGCIAGAAPLILISHDLIRRVARSPVLLDGILATHHSDGEREFARMESESGR